LDFFAHAADYLKLPGEIVEQKFRKFFPPEKGGRGERIRN